MNRRGFLSTVATASAGLVVGDAALDAWDRLTWKRRLFPGWSPRSSDVIRHLTGLMLYRQTETGWELVDRLVAHGPPPKQLRIGPLRICSGMAVTPT